MSNFKYENVKRFINNISPETTELVDEEKNKLVTLVPYVATDVLGKATSDLQAGVEVVGDTISGTLHYLTDYTGFSGKASEQKGNFLAVFTPILDGETIVMELVGGTTDPQTLDDGIIVLRITDAENQSLKLTATKAGVTKEYNFKFNLTLEEE